VLNGKLFPKFFQKSIAERIFILYLCIVLLKNTVRKGCTAYSGDSRSPNPMISVHSDVDLLYRRQS